MPEPNAEIVEGCNSNADGLRENRRTPNEDDFKQIYAENQRRMFNIAYRILRNTEDAEDAVQQAFLQLSQKYSQFREEAKISTYLCSIVINEALQICRKERRVCVVPLEYELQDGELIEIPELAVNGNHHEYGITIEGAVSNLSNSYRKVWILHDYLGCEHREIAKILGCSVGTSKSDLCRARIRLREIINSEQKPRHQKNNSEGLSIDNLDELIMALHREFLLAHPEISSLIA